MKHRLLCLLFLFCLLPHLLAENEEGWVALFDGQSTNGWTPRAEVTRFVAKDGELQILSQKNVWIVTKLEMADFVLEAEVKLPDDAAETGFNSGLAFRCSGDGKPKGYQLEIDLKKPGGVFGIGLGGWLYPTGETAAHYAERAKGAFLPNEWNRLRVECRGPKIRTFVNGKPIAEIEDSQSLRGFFGIQHHGKGGTVRFRNLRARELK